MKDKYIYNCHLQLPAVFTNSFHLSVTFGTNSGAIHVLIRGHGGQTHGMSLSTLNTTIGYYGFLT